MNNLSNIEWESKQSRIESKKKKEEIKFIKYLKLDNFNWAQT